MKRLISLIIVVLVLSIPIYSSIASAQSNLRENPDFIEYARLRQDLGEVDKEEIDITRNIVTEDLGEVVAVNVKQYEPMVVPTNVMEENSVPVFAYLEGYTTGSLYVGREKQISGPLYGSPKIKRIHVRPLESNPYVAGISYYPPPNGIYSLDNLGAVLVMLKKIERESEIPEEESKFQELPLININMSARIFFKESNILGLSEEEKILGRDADEKKWLERSDLSEYEFFDKRGYIRAVRIGGDSASFQIYDNGLRRLNSLSLKEGQVSGIMSLGLKGLPYDRFRVELVSVVDPSEDRASIEVEVNGEVLKKSLSEGEKIYSGSDWRVYKIDYDEDKDKKEIKEIVDLRGDSLGNTKQLQRSYSSIQKVQRLVNGIWVDVKISDDKEGINEEKDYYMEGGIWREVPEGLSAPKRNIVKKGSDLKGLLDSSEDETIEEKLSCDNIQDGDERTKGFCDAINEFKSLKDEHGSLEDDDGVKFSVQANYWIAKSYEELKDYSRAIEFYKLAENFKSANSDWQRLERDVLRGINNPDVYIEEENARLTLKGIKLGEAFKLESYAELVVDGERKRVGKGSVVVEEEDYDWVVSELDEDKIEIARRYVEDGKKKFGDKKTLRVGRGDSTRIDDTDVRLVNIEFNKEVIINIIPAFGEYSYSESSFILHIPVEKRAIDLSPDQIYNQIAKTEDKIRRLNEIISKLERVVEGWKKLCLGVFAFLTVKNSFLEGRSRNLARMKAMRDIDVTGKDGKTASGGWKSYCREYKLRGYDSYDKCLNDHADLINKDIDRLERSIDETNKVLKSYDFDKEEERKEFFSNYDIKNGTLLFKYNAVTEEDMKDLVFLKNFDGKVDGKVYDDELKRYASLADKYGEVDGILETNYKDKKDSTEYFIARNSLITQIVEDKRRVDVVEISEVLKKKNKSVVAISVGIYEKDGKHYFVNEHGEKVSVSVLKDDNKEVKDKDYFYYEDADNIYRTKSIALEGYNKNYYNAKLHIDSKGKPVMIPIKGGLRDVLKGDADYILVEHSATGIPIFSILNVGDDGKMGSDDDIYKYHSSQLDLPENRRVKSFVRGAYDRASRGSKGQTINLYDGGRGYVVDDSEAIRREQESRLECQDIMDPGDCRVLFGVCDPVMCPSSRFNLGGRWQVDNVVETGIIGSSVLGLHNFDLYEPVPVCMTGILAGLKAIRSVLEGYVQCLNSAAAEDKSIGICDKIRSVYTCELLWREVLAMIKARGSILGIVRDLVFGEAKGGGEYSNFEDSFNNVANSVKFFTSYYADTAFAAYKGRSIEEVGSEVCKAAIYHKLPAIGEFVDQISKPENPPQFTASFDEFSWSESAGLSRYSVFYHIYAGTDVLTRREIPSLRYSVYLRNALDNRFYVSEACNKRVGGIDIGGYADYNLDCIDQRGFNEICVSIEGRRLECGFGKVSTSFALGYVNDFVVKDEVGRNIKNVKECVPSSGVLSPSLSPGLLSGVSLPGEYGILRTGISRVCSINNPGAGTDSGRWVEVGSCDKDDAGRNLGFCWLDKNSIRINDLEMSERLEEELELRGIEISKGAEIAKGYLTKEESEQELRSIDESYDLENIKDVSVGDLIKRYGELIKRTWDEKLIAKIRLRIGRLLFESAKTKSISVRGVDVSEQRIEEKTCDYKSEKETPCCDRVTNKFKGNEVICGGIGGINEDYVFDEKDYESECGKEPSSLFGRDIDFVKQVKPIKRKCSGSSSGCDGELIFSDSYDVVDMCTGYEICETGKCVESEEIPKGRITCINDDAYIQLTGTVRFEPYDDCIDVQKCEDDKGCIAK